MTQHGHRRDAELEAMCDYCRWLHAASTTHADDLDLRLFARRCHMITLHELMREKEATGKQIFDDRLADCAECRAANGLKACIDQDTKEYIGCKWSKGKQKVEFVKSNFGDQATVFLEKYKDVKTRRVQR